MDPELEMALSDLDSASIGRRLKDARLAAGLTQPQAGGTDASAAYLSRIESGARRPGPRLLEQLCARLGVTPELIIRGTVPPDVRALECEVDFAELALLSGTPDDALERAARFLGSEVGATSGHLAFRACLVKGSALAAKGDTVGAIDAFQDLVDRGPGKTIATQANLRLSRLLREAGDLDRSISVAEVALAGLREAHGGQGDGTGPSDDITSVSVTLAAAYWERGDTARALTICRQAIAVSESSGSPKARAAAYWNTAIIESEAGRLDEALNLTRRALALFENESDLRLRARLRTQLGELLLRTDPPQTDEALRLLTEAHQTLAFAAADAPEVLHTRLALARARLAAGDSAAAEADAASCLREGEGLPFVSATAATLLGRIALSARDVDGARGYFLRAIQSLTGAGADRRAAQLWFDLGAALDDVGLDDEAKDAYRRAAVSTGLAAPSSRARQSMT